jgi:formate hydrogenlyase transcriptional activator
MDSRCTASGSRNRVTFPLSGTFGRRQAAMVNGEIDLQQRLHAIIEINTAVTSSVSMQEIFQSIVPTLHSLLHCQFGQVLLYDPGSGQLQVAALDYPGSRGINPKGALSPTSDAPSSVVFATGVPTLVEHQNYKTTTSDVVDLLEAADVRSGCCVPLVNQGRVLGTLSIGSTHEAAFGLEHQELLTLVAGQLVPAIANAASQRVYESAQQQLAREHGRLQLLLDINNVLVSKRNITELFSAISTLLRTLMKHEYSQIVLHDRKTGQLVVRALDFPHSKGFIHEGLIVTPDSPAGRCFAERRGFVIDELDTQQFPSEVTERLLGEGVHSICLAPLVSHNDILGVLSVGSSHVKAFSTAETDLLAVVASQVALAIENALAFDSVKELNERLATENLYLEEAVRTEAGFEEIVGNSTELNDALKRIALVAHGDSTVLILGETGTGKEMIARAIHNLSPRRGRPFVKLNCAAIPSGLLESELFGHEKGAFTGAIAQRIGRFEVAHGGTLFLDEVGDIPLDLQPKLLRVLQEKSFERLGGRKTIDVDVRLLAATNRNLDQMLESRQFRSDLYYRLAVFPVEVPPLRNRRGDIPQLVRYFIAKYARRMGKSISVIPSKAMRSMENYAWPGNVRELENFIERALILSRGPVLNAPLDELRKSNPQLDSVIQTLDECEREHIIRALNASQWVIGGPHGAATKLGVKRTTLNAKIRKLGIQRQPEGGKPSAD